MIQKQPIKRYAALFTRLAAKNEGAFIPFVVLGDPNIDASYAIIETMIANGADALELGIPFSDPLADGPEIQSAVLRAFDAGMMVDKAFALIEKVRAHYPDIPIGLLMYSNLIHKNGITEFYTRAQQVGVDSILVADVPLREYAPFLAAANSAAIDAVFICPPNMNTEMMASIAKVGSGYTYLVSRSGVTGCDKALMSDITQRVSALQRIGAPPVIQGFGISTPEQVAFYRQCGVKGVISGSAIARIIRDNAADESAMLAKLSNFIRRMEAATLLCDCA